MNLVREGNERLLEGERVNEVVWKCLMNMLIANTRHTRGNGNLGWTNCTFPIRLLVAG